MTNRAATAQESDLRRAELETWLGGELGGPFALEPASADASFRRYFRVFLARGGTRIAMDAPPDKEDTRQFLHVAGLMRAAGINVPEIYAAAPVRGFILLSDLGTQTYRDVIDASNADALFDDALAALVRLQCATRPGQLPDYDEVLLRSELELFPEWFAARHLDRPFVPALRRDWESLCTILVERALAQPRVFVHRDFMIRNLMMCEPRPGVLDFQDAVVGPIAYDVLSLFRDACITWDDERVALWTRRYLEKARAARLPAPDDPEAFGSMFGLIGVQRHLKVAGIFARLAYRDGKQGYLEEVPRILAYLRAAAPRYPECAPLGRILDFLEVPA